MRVNISNHTITSIDFDNVDQVIDFIKKFNEQSYSTQINTPCIYDATSDSISTNVSNNPSLPWNTVTRVNSENTPCSNLNK